MSFLRDAVPSIRPSALPDAVTRALGVVTAGMDRFVPEALRKDESTALRARFIMVYVAVTVLSGPIIGVAYILEGQHALAAATFFGSFLGFLVPAVLRRTGSVRAGGNFGIAIYVLAQVMLLVLSGGYDTGTLYWLAVTPLFASFVAGLGSGLVWLALVTGTSALLTTFATVGDILPVMGRPPSQVAETVAAILLALILVTLASIYETSKRQMMSAVEHARAQAERESHAKGEFLAMMSHEIRTPLNGILGMADALLLEPLSPVERERVAIIKRSGEGLLRAVNDVLDGVRLDANAVPRVDMDFDAVEVVRDVAALFQPTAARKGLHIDVLCPAGAVRVRSDAGKIRQVLSNLVANAVRYTEVGTVTLRFSVDRVPAGSPTSSTTAEKLSLRFAVEDTGVGLTADQLARIDQPFVRFVRDDVPGTGLGLAICKILAQTLGGEVVASSVPGRGSTFTLAFTCEAVSPEPAAPAAGRSSAVAAQFQGRVLVVEDNPVNREVARLLLQSRGLAVDLAVEGSAALAALDRARYDVVLMDCQMPGLDGYATTRAIRMRTGADRTTRIVAMTAATVEGDREKCAAAGMDDYMAKPITSDAIDSMLRRHLTPPDAASRPGPPQDARA